MMSLDDHVREFQYNQCIYHSRDGLDKIAWVRQDFLSQGKISDILIPCARKDFLSQGKISDIYISLPGVQEKIFYPMQGKISDIFIQCAEKIFYPRVKSQISLSGVQEKLLCVSLDLHF